MRRLGAFAFAQAVEQRIAALERIEPAERSRLQKRLREELYPLSRLALHLQRPGRPVQVQGCEDSGRADGQIWLGGHDRRKFEVQVTWAGNGDPQAGPVTDWAAHLAALIHARLHLKSAKDYAPGTLLLIAFDEPRLHDWHGWQALNGQLGRHEPLLAGQFSAVWLCNCASNALERLA